MVIYEHYYIELGMSSYKQSTSGVCLINLQGAKLIDDIIMFLTVVIQRRSAMLNHESNYLFYDSCFWPDLHEMCDNSKPIKIISQKL